MFREFYGLTEEPFGVTPNSHSFYPSPTHREALASLSYGIEAGRGFLALIAKPGMGKTTLLFQLLEQLQDATRTAFIFLTQCDSRELLHYVLADFGFETPGRELAAMHNQLNESLARGVLGGKRFVLIIDEAQNLDDSVLETIRLLSDFETPREKLLQIVLAGQPRLAEKLLQPTLAQLRQRIAIVSRLEPFSHQEVLRYIDNRLRVAGHTGESLFTPEALRMITVYSEGIPRNINNLCFNALSLGCALQRRPIDSKIIREVVTDLDLSPLVQERFRQCAVTGPVAPQLPSPPAKQEPKLVSRWFRRAALVATFILAGLFSLFYVGGNGGKIADRTTPTRIQATGESADSELAALPPALISDSSRSAPQLRMDEDADRNDATEDSAAQTFTIVVGRRQTLQRISRRYFGHFNPKLVDQIAALNPDLKDPSRLRAGQTIRLPMPPRRQEQTSRSNSRSGVTARGKHTDE